MEGEGVGMRVSWDDCDRDCALLSGAVLDDASGVGMSAIEGAVWTIDSGGELGDASSGLAMRRPPRD